MARRSGRIDTVPGDSRGGLFEADSNFGRLMGVQHAICGYKDSPKIVSLAYSDHPANLDQCCPFGKVNREVNVMSKFDFWLVHGNKHAL